MSLLNNCFGKKDNDASKGTNEEVDKQKKSDYEKRERIVRNYTLLREDIYTSIMKPYFKTGYDHKQFGQLFLNEKPDQYNTQAVNERQKPQNNCCSTYIIINPQESKFYRLWEIVFFLAIVCELFLFPFTLCFNYEETMAKTQKIELVIDIVWLFQIYISFVTAYVKEIDTVSEWPQIAIRYIQGAFFFDLLSTVPALIFIYGTKYSEPLEEKEETLRNYRYIYFLKILRIYHYNYCRKIMNQLITGYENKLSKQSVGKLDYLSGIMFLMTFVIHYLACFWFYLGVNIDSGEAVTDTWIKYAIENDLLSEEQKTDKTALYITSFYWVVTTLTTVGYGDIKGIHEYEYVYTMMVEFIGIAFFSFIMGSINNVLLIDSADSDIIESKLEKVDVWLVKLDNSRMSKSLPKILYDKIKLYIKESLTFDHKKLIEGYEFLDQLKPGIRYDLIRELFEDFFKDFDHIFQFNSIRTGREFMSKFVSQLYCRVFITNQTIVKKGEYFSELYMIFQGKVTLSLAEKDENEYFQLYATNYFGDYQILFDYKASECYKSSVDKATYTHCLKKKDLKELMSMFPDAKAIFEERARERRIEFRRIKKTFEMFAGVDPDPVEDQEKIKDQMKFKIQPYTDGTGEQPPFLTEIDFYFEKKDHEGIKLEDLKDVSDSERTTKQTQEDLEKRQKEKTDRALRFLDDQLTATNEALQEIKTQLEANADQTINYIKTINDTGGTDNTLDDQDGVEMPKIENLQNCLSKLQNQFQQNSIKH